MVNFLKHSSEPAVRVQKATQLASVKSGLKGEKQSLPTRRSHSTAILNQANKSEFSTVR